MEIISCVQLISSEKKMNATIELKDCNFVIVANNFNLSIINTVWLFKNQIFTEDELQGSTNLPVVVQLQSEYFQMLLYLIGYNFL